jgi:hypothetical protein
MRCSISHDRSLREADGEALQAGATIGPSRLSINRVLVRGHFAAVAALSQVTHTQRWHEAVA